MIPTGTLIQKMYAQENWDKITPPRPGPAIEPNETNAPWPAPPGRTIKTPAND